MRMQFARLQTRTEAALERLLTIHDITKTTTMPPPSKVAIATGSVLRLVKEEASYHKETVQQEERIKKLEESAGDENKEYTLRQEVRPGVFQLYPSIVADIITEASTRRD
jgi:plastocyanin